ncbi:hypothetical protein GLP30_13475 [Photobacterium phosphoreum]|uniref:Uncharacterized protein n=1 Tax=Photobacterium phosphoreum TaxID=659 RepID=A0AAW4ZU27_PHOPO|nr:hypothetical protein [Photobacterium phosphoreum]MCD9491728.1 hypothetical protein [Photobacterium phosphoreum]MCF2191097.1 hypothetical protein [Photobacterium phosphoreum]MCF2302637.1 hypothetical protein [Photobacterium phosphoreum]
MSISKCNELFNRYNGMSEEERRKILMDAVNKIDVSQLEKEKNRINIKVPEKTIIKFKSAFLHAASSDI